MLVASGDGSVTQFFARLQAGDQSAVDRLWKRFFPRLVGLAKKTLAGRTVRCADAEDAAQSAFITFWKRTQDGGFNTGLRRNDLWNLLAKITVRKAQRQLRHERAKKRGGDRRVEQVLEEDHQLRGEYAGAAFASICPPEFDVLCEELLLRLDDQVRAFALLKLMGYEKHEIASILECTVRTVDRKLATIRWEWRAPPAEC